MSNYVYILVNMCIKSKCLINNNRVYMKYTDENIFTSLLFEKKKLQLVLV